MNEQEYYRRVDQLVTRMNRMETLMQQLLTILTSSHANVERTMQMETMLQELRLDPDIHTAGINPGAIPPQERPEIRAIRDALQSGDRMKAIRLYRGLYGVGLKEAQDALDTM